MLKKILFNVLAFLGLMVSLFFAENALRQKPLTFLGSEQITVLSLDPGAELELTWAYAYDPDGTSKNHVLRDIGFGEITFSGAWQDTEEGKKTAEAGGTLFYSYPPISAAGYVFCFRVTGGQAEIEHHMPGNSQTITLHESGSEIIPVSGMYQDAARYRFPFYYFCVSLLVTFIFFYFAGKGRKDCIFPEEKEAGIPLCFQLLSLIGLVLSAANSGQSASASFPANAFYVFLFVFISGYFYQEANEQNILKSLLEKAKQSLLPLYFWNFVYAVLTALLAKAGFSLGEKITFQSLFLAPVYSGTQFSFMSPVWFIVPLFIIEAGTIIFRKWLGSIASEAKKDRICVALSLLSGVLGMVLSGSGLNPGWGMAAVRILCLIPFYQAGYLYQKYLEKRDTASNVLYFAAVLGLYLIFLGVKSAVFGNEHPLWTLLPGFLKIAFWLRIARILTSGLVKVRWVGMTANSAFSILTHQSLGFFLVNTIYAAGWFLSDSLYPDFNRESYFHDIGYRYIPREFQLSQLNYVVAGIGAGILIKLILDRLRARLMTKISDQKQ